ncbi:MAG: VWA domain-containing protein [Phycisphaerae bacterium]|nr:VWA domain-containing protein [Phycisphaerae bacterium]
MRANPFEGQLERLARTLTEQFGVTVLCQGDCACTDGKRILLPSLPEPMDEPLERMVVGYLDHEMGHVAFSDFKVLKKFSEKHPGAEGLLNVVEDALVERKVMQRWPGVRANLDAMFRQVRGRVMSRLREAGPFRRFCTAVYLKLSHHHDMLGLNKCLAGYEDLLDGFASVKNSFAAAELAERLLDRWCKNNPPQKAQQPPPDATASDVDKEPTRNADGDGESSDSGDAGNGCSNPNGESEESEAAGASDDNSQGDAGEADEPDEPDDADDADEADGENADGKDGDRSAPESGPDQDVESQPDEAASGDQPTGTAGSKEEAPAGAETGGASVASGQGGDVAGALIAEVLAEAIAESIAQADPSTRYRVFTKQHDRIEVIADANEQDVKALLATGVDTVRRLRRGLANALRSAEKRWWREEQDQGDLSPRTLHQLCMDRPSLNVFRTRAMVQGRSTAVGIALDASGSMTTQKMDVARASMRVLLEALHDLKTPTEAFTFTTGEAFTLNDAAGQTGEDMVTIRQRFSRFSNLEIGLIKRYEEPVKAAMRRLPGICGTGLTPLGEAMLIGAGRLAARPESRKIMLVLTDGRAGCEACDQSACHHAKQAAMKIAASGIELVGVGIMDESLQEIVSDTIVVHHLEDLPAQLCKLLGRTLQRGLKHVG